MRFIIFILLTCLPLLGFTQNLPSSNVESLIIKATKNDPLLKQISNLKKSEKVKNGNVFEFPPLQINYGFFILPIETKSGPQRHKISVKQKFPWPGLQHSINSIPYFRAALFDPQKQRRIQTIKLEVEKNAWIYWHHQRQIELTEAHLVLLDSLIRSAQTLNEIGKTQKSSVSLVILERAKVIDRLDEEKSSLNAAQENLKRWVGEDVLFGIFSPPRLNYSTAMKIEIETHAHPELLSLHNTNLLDSAKIKTQEKKDLPTFSIGVDYFEIGEDEKGKGGRDAMMAGIGVSIPLWSSSNSAEIESLNAKILARTFEIEEVKINIKLLSTQKLIALKDSIRKIVYLEKTIIPLAEIYRADLTSEFETNRARITEVIQAMDRVYRLQLSLVSARAESAQHLSELEFELGQALKIHVKQDLK